MPKITEAGRYMAKVLSSEVGEAQTGTPFVSLDLETTGPDGDEGKHITAYLYLSERAFERTAGVLRDVFGFDGEFADLEKQVNGRPCSITVEEEEDDQGEVRMKVAWVNSPRRSKPVEEGFLAKLTRKARELGMNPRRAPVPAAATVAADEDVPF